METVIYCQSCGMPLLKDEDFGTDKDGSSNHEYCRYCYADGSFTSDCTMDEMIGHCVEFLDEFNKDNATQFTKEQAVAEMKKYFPTLKRWASSLATEIVAMERAALEKWNQGDPSGYLDIYSPAITYFDPFQDKRLDGFDAMKGFYEGLRGKVSTDRYEMLNPVVETSGDMAVLSYNLISYSGAETYKWNCTEVYRKEENKQWRIIHSHWSFINAGK